MSAAVGKNGIRLLPKLPLVWILLGYYLLFFFGCSRRPVLSHKVPPGKNVYHEASPADLSPYIRTVLKISQEDTENRQALKELHEQRPALKELLRHIAESPDGIESRRTLAAHYLKEGLYYSAFELYEQIRSTGLEDATAELGLARIWDEWGHYPLAKRHAERVLELDPRSAEALELLGTIHLHRNDLQAAVSTFLEALALTPENPSLHSTIGRVLLKLGNSGEARGYLEEAVALDPALIEARNNLAEALARLGDSDGALQEFAAANPPAAAFNKLGLVYLADRRWEKARNAFKQALVQDPDDVKVRLNLSIAQSYLPPPTIIHLPSLEVASSGWQAYGIGNSRIKTRLDEDTRISLIADAETAGIEDVEHNRQEHNPASPNPQPVLSGTSVHLPTTTMVYLPPFEESSPNLYSPDLIPNTRDQEEKQVSELKLTVQDPFTGPKLSPTLNVFQLQTPSRSDPMDGEPLEEHVFLVGPLAERKLVPAFPPDDDGALGNVVPEQIVSLGKGVNSVPRIVLETSGQISALDRSAYLDPAVFLLNPNLVRGDGQVHQNPLSPLADSFTVIGGFDIRDFIAPFRDPVYQHQHQWKSSLLLGPQVSAEYPLKGGLSGVGLGVVLCLLVGGPLGTVVWKQTQGIGQNRKLMRIPVSKSRPSPDSQRAQLPTGSGQSQIYRNTHRG
ncbi:MAG: tetratricopeptide repeat protein [Acidobacteria bacterium]|nr:MAG: tetratricopeptide repeat protein [Acidobacteriota bacterium]